jgi:hypothetical protein
MQHRKMADNYNSVREYGFDPEWEYIISAMAHTFHMKASVGHGKSSTTELLGPFRLMELSKQAHMDVRNKQIGHLPSQVLDKKATIGPGDRPGIGSKGLLHKVLSQAEQKA